ncbi:MAG: L-lactate dehydrogenase complex protein LldE [Candidatus Azotimanducaceae bacterium]|jgi:L-lactate dehydrogenase complex protein LldE
MKKTEKKEVALFITCLVDNLRPDIGFDTVKVIEQCGFTVVVPDAQTCCGQPNFNGGDQINAKRTAKVVIDIFLEFEYTVIPSGSCGGMIKQHYVDLFDDDPIYRDKAELLAGKVFELSHFLTEIADFKIKKKVDKKVTYHDACAGLRELGVKKQPRSLLDQLGVEIIEMEEPEVCCGFGGAFCVKYPEISNEMVEKKIRDAINTGADALVTGDVGCLMNMEGKIERLELDLPVYHFVELLAKPEIL